MGTHAGAAISGSSSSSAAPAPHEPVTPAAGALTPAEDAADGLASSPGPSAPSLDRPHPWPIGFVWGPRGGLYVERWRRHMEDGAWRYHKVLRRVSPRRDPQLVAFAKTQRKDTGASAKT